MKIVQNISLSTMMAIALVGCGTTKSSISTSTNYLTAKNVPLKNGAFTEIEKKRWSHLDLIKDTIPGMSVDRAYTELLKDKKPQKVVVAVIDSGTDIEHEDLKGHIWNNPKEIPENGIDDDNNGYIDDIHGWNFLGNSNNENLEMTRILKTADKNSELYKKTKEKYDEKYEKALGNKQQVDFLMQVEKSVSDHLKKKNYTADEVKAILTTDAILGQNKMIMTQILSGTSKENFDKEMKEYEEYVYDQLNYHLNLEFDGRKIVGDDVNNIKDTRYGDNNVMGPDKKQILHGTHVAGIIAQIRGNNLGGDGVASSAEIMVLRAVPNGDEYDKDIALAIRYAADNGAKVINGSFGKGFSPHKEWVYDAIKYAASKDVLFVHAAGNDAEDLNVVESYPNDRINDKEIADNFIKVGAIGKEYGTKMVASFSNYGKKDVDVFAPGVEIYATIPNNEYKYEQGTSMASPNVAGVAALIRAYYPQLTASQVKHILKESGISIDKTVVVGGEDANKEPFVNLSTTGKIVNAYNALLMAEKISKK